MVDTWFVLRNGPHCWMTETTPSTELCSEFLVQNSAQAWFSLMTTLFSWDSLKFSKGDLVWDTYWKWDFSLIAFQIFFCFWKIHLNAFLLGKPHPIYSTLGSFTHLYSNIYSGPTTRKVVYRHCREYKCDYHIFIQPSMYLSNISWAPTKYKQLLEVQY